MDKPWKYGKWKKLVQKAHIDNSVYMKYPGQVTLKSQNIE